MSIDTSVFNAIHGLAGDSVWLDFLGVFFAKYLPYFIIVGFLVGLLFVRDWRRRFYDFVLITLSILLARGIILEFIRFVYYRPRPELVLSVDTLIETPSLPSFPSGHAAVFFALGAALWFLNKKWGLFLLSAALIVSVGRVFVGVHWPSDVIVGALIGVFCAYIVKLALPKVSQRPATNN